MKLLTQTPPPLPPTSVDDSHFFGKQMRKQRQTTQKSMLYKYAMCASCLSVCVRPSVCVPSWGSVCVRLSVYIYYGQDGRQGSQCVLERHINYTTFWGHPRNPSTRRELAYKNKRTSKFRWVRNFISNRLTVKPGNFIFWPFFAKIDDVTSYKKCENCSKNTFSQKWWKSLRDVFVWNSTLW